MKIIKGSKWLKRDFLEQLEQLFETNHVVELDNLVKFNDKEQLIRNMITSEELAKATNNDVKWQNGIELTKKEKTLKDEKFRDKLKEEEAALKTVMGL